MRIYEDIRNVKVEGLELLSFSKLGFAMDPKDIWGLRVGGLTIKSGYPLCYPKHYYHCIS